MRSQLITLEPVEDDLSPAHIDARLAEGWFPWGGQWMTCRAWPIEEGPCDTIWVRVRLAVRPPSDRRRRLVREGCRIEKYDAPLFDEEHQRLYDTFRTTRHPDWVKDAAALVRSQNESPFLPRTREIAVRDAGGRLIAFRWFLDGGVAIAGMTAIYDTARDGLGTIARTLADEWAAREGYQWTYPGYVLPGAGDPWYYKIKRGRTEWLDPDRGHWRAWDGDEPDPERLALAEMRRQLAPLGEVTAYPAWALPYLDPTSNGLASPYYVAGPESDGELTLVIWNPERGRREELRVVRRARVAVGEAAGPPDGEGDGDGGDAGS